MMVERRERKDRLRRMDADEAQDQWNRSTRDDTSRHGRTKGGSLPENDSRFREQACEGIGCMPMETK